MSFARLTMQVMVLLDSGHNKAHVLDEMEAYCPLVTVNSYCIVEVRGQMRRHVLDEWVNR